MNTQNSFAFTISIRCMCIVYFFLLLFFESVASQTLDDSQKGIYQLIQSAVQGNIKTTSLPDGFYKSESSYGDGGIYYETYTGNIFNYQIGINFKNTKIVSLHGERSFQMGYYTTIKSAYSTLKSIFDNFYKRYRGKITLTNNKEESNTNHYSNGSCSNHYYGLEGVENEFGEHNFSILANFGNSTECVNSMGSQPSRSVNSGKVQFFLLLRAQ